MRSEPKSLPVLIILSTLMGFASISTDLYLPALPSMAASLDASPGVMEWTISGYLIGLCAGQMVWGPISDRRGRRLPIAVGMVLFALGSAGCALSGSPGAIIAWRIVQAVGASAGVVLGRAMVRDLYEGPKAAQMLSTLLTVMAIAPLLGPLAGAQILALAGWRAIFLVLVAIGILTLASLALLPETLPPERRSTEPIGRAFAGYPRLLADPRLLAYIGTGGFFYAAMFAYLAGSPFAYITYHHLPAKLYGLVFATGVVGLMAANLANARLVPRFGSDRLMRAGAAVAAASGLAVALSAATGWGGLAGLAVPIFFFLTAMGFIVANSIAGALADHPERAGAISALVGALQYGSGIVGSGLLGLLADGTPWPMGLLIALGGMGSFASTLLLKPRRSRAGR